jgi:hypothetical protein
LYHAPWGASRLSAPYNRVSYTRRPPCPIRLDVSNGSFCSPGV